MATITIPVDDGTSLPAYLARAGFLTIAPEFYHREAAPGRWLERDDAGRQEGFGYLSRLLREQAVADVAAALARDDAWRRIVELLAS